MKAIWSGAIAVLAACGGAAPREPSAPLAPPATELSTSQQVANIAGAPLRWTGAALVYPLKGLLYDLPAELASDSADVRDVAAATAALDGPIGLERARAAQRLAELAPRLAPQARADCAARIARLLDDAYPPVRPSAALALGALGDAHVGPFLAMRLKDPDPALRGACAIGLGRLGDRRAGPLLVELASSPWGEHWFVALAIAQAGAALREAELIPHARALLARPPLEAGWLAPAVAMVALGRHGDRASLQAIAERLGAAHPPDVRAAAALAMGELGERDRLAAALELARSAEDELPLVIALGRYGRAEARDAVARRLASPDPRVRAHAAGALVELRDERGVEGLLDGVQSASIYERFYCLGRLERLADGAASPGFSQKAWRGWWMSHRAALVGAWATAPADSRN